MSENLTGNFIYRSSWRRKLILVVEYVNAYDATDDTPECIQTKRRWRDAKISDLITLTRMEYHNE